MASIIMKRGTTSEISNTPISDGQILFERNTKNMYVDEGANRIKYNSPPIDIDNKLSTTSKNPVQNKVITNKVNNLEGRVTAIQGKVDTINPQADSGYVIIGNTLIQWGRKTFDTRANDNYVYTNISLPIPFADVNYSINLIPTYSIDVTSYYDASPTYTDVEMNRFQARAISKSGGFTTTNFPSKAIAVTWIAIGKCTEGLIARLKVNGSSTQLNLVVGSSAMLEASTINGSGSYTYKFVVKNINSGSTSILQDYSSSTSYSGPLVSAGTREFIVYVKDSNGTVVESNTVSVIVTA